MSLHTIQVRYTGDGPRQNVWLNAQDPGGFMCQDKHKTRAAAEAEAERLRLSRPEFLDPRSDWQIRVVSPHADTCDMDEDCAPPCPVAVSSSVTPTPSPSPRKKKKTRKKIGSK